MTHAINAALDKWQSACRGEELTTDMEQSFTANPWLFRNPAD